MSPSESPAESIFFAALAKESPQERIAYLDEACGGDAELRRRVERLLLAQAKVGSFLEGVAVTLQATVVQPESCETAGAIIGPYKLIEQIGEGGMGTVWMAQQTEPVKALVALKLIKAGMDSKQFIARFEAERQALALMEHPNIARVLDGGTTTGEPGGVSPGRPYFVMDLVKGVPITKFCDEHHLTPKQRLELFIPVCQAVQHAHQKGIIHRDLKPSNVLVALYDPGTPGVPKVIDFGVAKAAGQPLTEKTLVTCFGNIVGTLEYMSPEQAEINQLDIDTRSDIYSLGVVLYELLTGSPPFTRKELEKAGMLEMLRVIREQEPSKPSTKLSTAEGLPTLAANRGTEPAKLTKLVRGELDWIVMKALEKDRSRRYETANSFAMDVQRYLADEVVEARPTRAGYRLRKFVKRNRGPVVAASLIVILLLGGIAGTTVGLLTARQQRDEAEKARLDEAHEAARAIAAERLASNRLAQVEAEKQRADEERAVAQAVSDFLQKDLLGQAVLMFQPAGASGKRDPNITVRTALDRAAAKVGTRFAKQPRVEAAIRTTLARAYYELGFPNEARIHAERSVELRVTHLGPDDADTLQSQVVLALVCCDLRLIDRMEAILLDVIRRQTATLGPRDIATLSTKNILASFSLDALHPNLARAAELLEEVVQGRTEQLGPENGETLVSKQNLAWLYRRQGEFERAEALFRDLLDIYLRKFGDDYPVTVLCKSNLGLVYLAHGKLEQAEPILVEVLQKRIDLEGEDTLSTNSSRCFLANLYRAQRKYDQAVPLYERALTAFRKGFGNNEGTLALLSELAKTRLEAKQLDKARQLIGEFINLCHEHLGAEDPLLANELTDIGRLLVKNEQYVEAEKHLRQSLAARDKKESDTWSKFNTDSVLGAALLGQKKYAEAEPLLLNGYEGMKRREDKIPADKKVRLTEPLERLVQLYDAWDKAEEVAKWRTELEKMKGKP